MSSSEHSDDFAAMLAQYDAETVDPQIGETARGTIISIGESFIFVDINAKAEAAVDRQQLVDEDGTLTVAIGDSVEGQIVGIDDAGNFSLRLRSGQAHPSRTELRSAWRLKLPVEGKVTALNKGGVEVIVAGVRGFCPISQLADTFVADASEFLHQRLEFLVQTYEERARGTNLVLSRRALLEQEKLQRAQELRRHLEVGAVLEGTINSITAYGAFVDLGGIDGLLHISEMSHRRIEDPREMFLEGQIIEAKVLRIDPPKKSGETERISLSTRALEQDPWQNVERRFPAGERFEGIVKRLETFGAFVELAEGVEGLVHISKLNQGEHLRHAREAVELGQGVTVEVLSVDSNQRKISLSLEGEPEVDTSEVARYRESKPEDSSFGSLASFFEKAK